jgi:hypothetical protein
VLHVDFIAMLQYSLGNCGSTIQEYRSQLARNMKHALRDGAIGVNSPLRVRGFYRFIQGEDILDLLTRMSSANMK